MNDELYFKRSEALARAIEHTKDGRVPAADVVATAKTFYEFLVTEQSKAE